MDIIFIVIATMALIVALTAWHDFRDGRRRRRNGTLMSESWPTLTRVGYEYEDGRMRRDVP